MSAIPTALVKHTRMIEVKLIRSEAARLLKQLQADRAASEQRLQELGQRDAVKVVTGRSAIEHAIETTQQLIAQADAVVHAFSDVPWNSQHEPSQALHQSVL